jgi:hypothetical protein
MDYQEYLNTPEWRAKREWALERAGRRCQVCNSAGQLHVHHRTYENLGHELPADLTVLCEGCHGLYHGKRHVSISPEAVADLIRSARRIVMMGPTPRRKSFVEPEEPTTEEYIRRTSRALSAFPENLRPIVAGAVLETQMVPAAAVLELLEGRDVHEVVKREYSRDRERDLQAIRRVKDQFRRTPA